MKIGLRQHFFSVILTGSLLILMGGCTRNASSPQNALENEQAVAEVTPSPTPYTTEAELLAVGDIMMHGAQIKSGYNPQTKTYNYDNFFTEVQNILSSGDWVIGNLETPLGGPDRGYTGYPLFNAPDTLADAIKKAGFNILTTANNHSLDRGEKGVLKTLENVKKRGLIPVGTAPNAKEAESIVMVEKNEISMAILAYTYGTNGIPIPKGKNYLVNLINVDQIKQDIAKARQLGADVITVALHFGTEYQRQPNTEQKALVKTLVNAGADIILGSHPHVVQPYQIFERTTEQGKAKQAVVIYSMGNFISNQRDNYKDLGVIFKVNIRKQFPNETIEFTQVEALPTWVHRYSKNGQYQFRVLPLEQVVKNKKDPLLSSQDYRMLEADLQKMNRHLNSLQSTTKTN